MRRKFAPALAAAEKHITFFTSKVLRKKYANHFLISFLIIQVGVILLAASVYQVTRMRGYVVGECPRMNMSQHSWIEFHEKYLFQENPVILTDVISKWPALTKWTDEYLLAKLGMLNVSVNYGPPGTLFGYGREGMESKVQMMLFKEFMKKFYDPAMLHYINLQPPKKVEGEDPDLRRDWNLPLEYLGEDWWYPDVLFNTQVSTNFWMGPGGMVSRAHHDGSENFLCMVSGQKRFLILPPTANLYMYAYENGAGGHFSQVDLDNPDYVKFPLLKNADSFRTECLVSEGEILFIPPHWWHQVKSVGRNVALNVWYNSLPPPMKFLVGLRVVLGF